MRKLRGTRLLLLHVPIISLQGLFVYPYVSSRVSAKTHWFLKKCEESVDDVVAHVKLCVNTMVLIGCEGRSVITENALSCCFIFFSDSAQSRSLQSGASLGFSLSA